MLTALVLSAVLTWDGVICHPEGCHPVPDAEFLELSWDGVPRPEGQIFQTGSASTDVHFYEPSDVPFDFGLNAQTYEQTLAPVLQMQQSMSEAMLAYSDRLTRLEHRLSERERVLDSFTGCVKSAFIVAGSDLASTGLARERCAECGEQNPLLKGDLGLIGAKLGQLGSQIAVCRAAAEGGTRATKIVTWTNRIVHGLAIAMNGYSAITGKPLIRWEAKPAQARR